MRLYEIEQNLKDLILRDCQPFIEEMGGWDNVLKHPVFRGLQSKFDFKKLEVNKNREPKDTSKYFHDIFVKAFHKAGFKANRHNSIFCTGNYIQAEEHGEVYYIFPIGNFDFTYSEDVHDMYQSTFFSFLYDKEILISKDIHNITPSAIMALNPPPKVNFKKLVEFFKDIYQDTTLIHGLETTNEIMISCDSYYAVHENFINEITGKEI